MMIEARTLGWMSRCGIWRSTVSASSFLLPKLHFLRTIFAFHSQTTQSLLSLVLLIVACHLVITCVGLRWMKNTSSTGGSEKRRRKREFLKRHPQSYGYGNTIDTWRSRELPQLLAPIHHWNWWYWSEERSRLPWSPPTTDSAIVYLDYAGAALPVRSQLQQPDDMMAVLANPHSNGPAASYTHERIAQVTTTVLRHLHAEPQRIVTKNENSNHHNQDENHHHHPGYEVVYTSGTTAALQTIAERFFAQEDTTACPTQCGTVPCLVYPQSGCHTSVLGMREVALAHGAQFACVNDTELIDWMQDRKCCEHCAVRHLVALPLECNLTGNNYRERVREVIRYCNSNKKRWYTVLDIAKAAATGPVDLRSLNPDFACLSFYKFFGTPTGLGGFLIQRTSMHSLFPTPAPHSRPLSSGVHRRRHYFGGGSIDLVLPQQDVVVPRRSSAALQNGTIHYRGIVELAHGFAELERVGGMTAIQRHVQCLGNEFVSRLRSLRHENGRSAIELYIDDDEPRSIVAFNVVRSDGSFAGYNEVAKLAALNTPPIQLRTGCMCNPGACQRVLQVTDDYVLRNYHETGHVCGDHVDVIRGRPTGVVRVSFGKDSLWEDLDACVSFLEKMFVDKQRFHSASIDKALDYDESRQSIPQATPVEVAELYIYPIKSCRGHRVRSWEIDTSTGRLAFDREFALVDSSGHALRLQSYPKMNLLQPEVLADECTLKVSSAGHSPLLIRFDVAAEKSPETVQICGDSCNGMVIGDNQTSDWFTAVVGVRCWLVKHFGERHPRLSSPLRSGSVAFANERPLLLISSHAVDLLNVVLKNGGQSPVQALQFRPNIVVQVPAGTGSAGIGSCAGTNIEDEWKQLSNKSGDLKLDVIGPCARCSMVDFHPDTGKRGKTLRALAQYRRANGQINFGIFLQVASRDHERTFTQLEEGETLSVSSLSSHC